MSEIVYDAKYSGLDLSSAQGLNLTNSSSRIKHSGSGAVTFESVSGQILIKTEWNSGAESIKLQSSYGGILLNSTKTISLQTTDATNGIKIGTSSDVPITLGNSSSTLAIKSSVTISGDFTVTGNTVQHNVSTYTVEDPIIVLGNGQSTPVYDLGFLGVRGTADNIAFFWDESVDQFAMVTTASTGGTTSINISGYANLRIADLTAVNMAGTLSTAAQTNVTSVGTLTGLTMGGNIDLDSNSIVNATSVALSTLSAASSDINVSITNTRVAGLTFKEGANSYLTFNTTANTITSSQVFNMGNGFQIAGSSVNASASELNTMDGISSTTSELNILSGVTSTAAELNILDGVSSSTAELNILDGVTSNSTELNYLAGLTTGQATASKALVTDGNNDISLGLGDLTATNLTGTLQTAAQTNITSVGTLTSLTMGGNLALGGYNLTNGGQISLDTLNAASNDVVISLTDARTAALSIKESSNNYLVFKTSNGFEEITSSQTLNIANGFEIAGTAVTSTATELNLVDGITAGTALASKAVILDASKDITGLNIVTATTLAGTLSTAAQTNVTSVGTLTGLTAAAEATIGGTATVGGQLHLTEGTNNGSNKITLQAPADLSANYSLILPADDGGASEYLQTDGNGTLTWAASGGGSTLAGASDSSFSSLASNDIMKYNGSDWVNTKTISITTLTATTLNGTVGTAAQTNITSLGTLGSLTTSGNVTLDNSGNSAQYIYMNYNATNTNHWRISVNSSGNLDFERYNGSSWISKSTIT